MHDDDACDDEEEWCSRRGRRMPGRSVMLVPLLDDGMMSVGVSFIGARDGNLKPRRASR